jgi:uncharacterized protein (UPF0335 family)
MSEIGHNSKDGVAGKQLLAFIERVETLETVRKDAAEDIKEIFLESKSSGYDPKVIKALIKLRNGDRDEQAEFASLLATYASAIGFQLPLGI